MRIVVETAADIVVAALGQRLVLVTGAAGGQLGRGQVQDAFAGALRHHVDDAKQVLIGIAKTEATSDSGFVKRSRTGNVEGSHALTGVPDVHHAVGVLVGSIHT